MTGGRLVRVVVTPSASALPPRLAEERHEHQPGHVEGGEPGAEQRGAAEQPALPARRGERRLDDRVLGEEAGQEREADEREVAAARR